MATTSNLEALQEFFPSGTSEGERHLLDKAFITPNQLATILNAPVGNPRLIVGSKGIGKTAILNWVHLQSQEKSVPCLLLRPDDLDTSPIGDAVDLATIKRIAYQCLIESVGAAIGQKLEGFLTEEDATLYHQAVKEGVRSPSFVSKITSLLQSIAATHVSSSATSVASRIEGANSSSLLHEAISKHLRNQDKVFFLLIDDTDQIASPQIPGHLNRIWGLMLAARKLAEECPYIKVIISLRTEAWARLTREDAAQRDQVDHFRPLVIQLRASEEYMSNILSRRLELAANSIGQSNHLQPFFSGTNVRLPSSDEIRPWDVFIVKSSRERPRDMIQFVGALTKRAIESCSDKITNKIVNDAMATFSQECAEDLAVEFQADCPVLLEVMQTFIDIDFETEARKLFEHLITIPSRFSVTVRHNVLKPDDQQDALILLGLLHETGFINPRVRDTSRRLGFDHISYLDDPHFVKPANLSKVEAATWEIHPVFRSYLIQLTSEKQKQLKQFGITRHHRKTQNKTKRS